ncbi:MAG: RusA family crossover junction endodeoxyribonuclease [Fuerstiella sp.]|nr:RusA family crossover junction endodeoxyribonuclease [Fuerstiella sp.]
MTLPWPPSNNTYYRNVNGMTLISAAGRRYRRRVLDHMIQLDKAGDQTPDMGDQRCCVKIEAYPPDKRKRDLDNLFKGTLDALTHAGVWIDDEQIDILMIQRMEVVKDGKLLIDIMAAPEPEPVSLT